MTHFSLFLCIVGTVTITYWMFWLLDKIEGVR